MPFLCVDELGAPFPHLSVRVPESRINASDITLDLLESYLGSICHGEQVLM